MDLILLLFTGVTVGISGAMIPGPLTLFTVSEVLKTNRFSGLKIISGHIFLEFIITVVIFFGLRRFISSQPFLSAVSAIGGLALILMAVLLIINAPKMKILDKKASPGFSKGLFAGGIFFSIFSPGFLVWWATVGISTVVKSLLFGVIGLVFLTLGRWSAVIVWQWFISYAVDKGKAYLSNAAYQNIIRFFSFVLIILGFSFVIR